MVFVRPKRRMQIQKMRDSANVEFRKQKYEAAVDLYGHAVNMALAAPPWETSTMIREELAPIYANRAAAYLALQRYPEALADAEMSIFTKGQQNPKAHFRKARALQAMQRLEEARDAAEAGLDFEPNERDLTTLFLEISASLNKQD